MAKVQQPVGTKRHGIGDRPYASYSIVKVDGEGKEVQVGLTVRVEKDGKTQWQAENAKNEKSGLFLVHREACEWLLDPKPAKAEPKKPAPKSGGHAGITPQNPATIPDLTKYY